MTASPLPLAPIDISEAIPAVITILDHPDLFKIVTPIKIDIFQELLKDHPNPPLVASVCRGLREGFWPYADHTIPDFMKTFDNSHRKIHPEVAEFIRTERDKEVRLERWSKPFGTELFEGMYAAPIGIKAKKATGKKRLIIDQSHEPYSPNSFIPKTRPDIPNDTLANLGAALLKARANHPDQDLVVWKSDVKSAYRLMPMHPLWQMRQVVTVDGQFHVDRCNCFGNRAGGWVWASFISLVLWIGVNVKGLEDLFGYVDDDFSWELADNLLYYPPYDKNLPAKQVKYLELWDELGIPHEEDKQLFGKQLCIIGFEVDPNHMYIKLPDDRREELLNEIMDLVTLNKAYSLTYYEGLAGLLNWTLDVYPLLRPGLSALYSDIKKLTRLKEEIPGEKIRIRPSHETCQELGWVARHLLHIGGIDILRSREWGPEDADFHVYTTACLTGIGLFFPSLNLGLQMRAEDLRGRVSYLKTYAVLCALSTAVSLLDTPSLRLAIFSDSDYTISNFDILCGSADYNPIILSAVDILLASNTSLRVVRFSPESREFKVAEGLAWFNNDTVLSITPELSISQFEGPETNTWQEGFN